MHPSLHDKPASPPSPVRAIFFDAEGTLWEPRKGKTFADFWADPTESRANEVFELTQGCTVTLDRLTAAGIRLIVVSKHNKRILPGLLRLFNLDLYFEDVLINGDKGLRVREWLKGQGIPRSAALMVGDRADLDILPLEREGIRAFLVDTEYNQNDHGERIDGLQSLLPIASQARTINA